MWICNHQQSHRTPLLWEIYKLQLLYEYSITEWKLSAGSAIRIYGLGGLRATQKCHSPNCYVFIINPKRSGDERNAVEVEPISEVRILKCGRCRLLWRTEAETAAIKWLIEKGAKCGRRLLLAMTAEINSIWRRITAGMNYYGEC